MARLLLEKLAKSYNSFYMTMIAGQRATPITFKQIVPLLFLKEAQEKRLKGLNDKALAVQDQRKGKGKGKPRKGKLK